MFVHRAAALLHAVFRPHLAMTPLRFANPSPPSGWIEDFHLQAVVHTRHTARGPPAQKNAGGRYHRSGRTHPALPARWAYDLYVISPVSGLVATVARADARASAANLTPASGRQDHTTSSSCRSRSSARDSSALRADRPPLPASNARDDRETSLFDRGGMAVDNHEIRKTGSRLFLARGLDRPNQLDGTDKFSFCAHMKAHDSSSSAASSRPKRRDLARRVGWAKQPPAGRSRAHHRPAHEEPIVGTARDEAQRATRIGARLCPPYPADEIGFCAQTVFAADGRSRTASPRAQRRDPGPPPRVWMASATPDRLRRTRRRKGASQ